MIPYEETTAHADEVVQQIAPNHKEQFDGLKPFVKYCKKHVEEHLRKKSKPFVKTLMIEDWNGVRKGVKLDTKHTLGENYDLKLIQATTRGINKLDKHGYKNPKYVAFIAQGVAGNDKESKRFVDIVGFYTKLMNNSVVLVGNGFIFDKNRLCYHGQINRTVQDRWGKYSTFLLDHYLDKE